MSEQAQRGGHSTLADAQPGGRVRLGDQAGREPMLESMWVEVRREGDRTFPRVMKRDQAEAFLRTCNVGPLPTTQPLYAALSAQPSPGGQGDARSQFEEYRGGDFERDAQGYYTNARTAQDWAMWQAALAARQPVGEPVAVIENGAFGGGGLLWIGPMPPIGTKLYAAPPAQAVDLGQQQDAARWRAIAPHLSVEWDEDEILKRWTWIDFKGDALSVPTRTRESYASVDEAMDAVIGSQAVSNG